MEILANDNSGYVYILEVKDIDLPVCKIEMTRRDPSTSFLFYLILRLGNNEKI